MDATLRFDAPATHWLEALPLGNGRVGAMVFGRPWSERIALNEATFWSGSPTSEGRDVVPADLAHRAVADARRAVLDGRLDDATAAVQRLQGRYAQAFVPLGDLLLEVRPTDGQDAGPVTAYHRRLVLDEARHVVDYRTERGSITWSAVVSAVDGVLQLTIDAESPVDVTVSFETPVHVERRTESGPLELELELVLRAPSDVPPPHEPDEDVAWASGADDAVRAGLVVGLRHDGTVDGTAGGQGRTARGARHIVLCLGVGTTFTGIGRPLATDVAGVVAAARDRVAAALAAGPRTILERHVRDHAERFGRVRLSLEGEDSADEAGPTDALVRGVDSPPALDRLLFDYGRYLLLASSRPGGTPATLQGLWNAELRPPWSSAYTLNANTEMNYWGAEPAGLPETLEPLFDLLDALAVQGAPTARRLYGSSGWVAHHNTDVWAYTSPVGLGRADPAWAFWPMGGVWLCLALAERVRFGGDAAFARDRALPVLRSAARFLLDWVIDVGGAAATAPSTSPENGFLVAGRRYAVGRSSSMDLSLAAELCEALTEVAELAGAGDDPVVAAARALRGRIRRISPGRDGLLREWADDPPQAEPGHRHLSHLVGLYPGTVLRDDDQLAAAAASLDDRGDDSTGWSLVWKMAARARLGQAGHVEELLGLLLRPAPLDGDGLRGGLYPNLFAAHPPFQVDANLGYVAAVCECLVQSHDGRIRLLPAVPRRWGAGTVTGLRARPGVRVDVAWDHDGGSARLRRAELSALTPAARRPVLVEHAGRTRLVDLAAAEVVRLTGTDLADAPDGRP